MTGIKSANWQKILKDLQACILNLIVPMKAILEFLDDFVSEDSGLKYDTFSEVKDGKNHDQLKE